MRTPAKSTSIEQLATAVYDNGRRGSPRPGCDCLQCFGYCIYDEGAAMREGFAREARDGNQFDRVGMIAQRDDT